MTFCRFSGYPGAWCLDCGRADPREEALGSGEVDFVCDIDKSCTCPDPGKWLRCPNFGPRYKNEFTLECTEPDSNRHNPYQSPDTKPESLGKGT